MEKDMNLGTCGRILLKWIFKYWDGDVDWIDLAQDREKGLAVLNATTYLRFL